MKFVLVSPKNRTVYNFRGDLIKEIKKRGYEVIVTGPNLEGIENIRELGARFEEIPLDKSGINIVKDMKYMYKLLKFLKKEQPEVTLAYTIKPVIYGSIAAKIVKVKNINSMITGVGYVFTANNIKAKTMRFFVSMLYKISFFFSDTVIFQNKDDQEEFVHRKLLNKNKSKLVNGSGVNMNNFTPKDYPKQLTFFMLSRILKNKGVREYLTAAKKVKNKHPHVKFILLGALENMQDSLSMDDLTPYIDEGIIEYFGETNDVTKYYEKSSVFVLPSYREGTPRTVLEAMAMARPIITTDAPGCRETVESGENGFTIPIKNCEELEKKMNWFIENHHLIPKMGEKSYELCKRKFDVKKVNESMISHLSLSKK